MKLNDIANITKPQLPTNKFSIYTISGDHDMPCPLTLACRSTLTTVTGREIAKYLIRHGANVNYQDHALRNALYWAVSLTISYVKQQSQFII